MARHALSIAVCLLCAACTHTIELLSLKDGTMATGTQSLWSQSVRVTLPSGEIATGSYTKLSTLEIGEGSLFFGANVGEMLGRHTTEHVYGYARLQGEQGTILEMVFASDWLGRGFGIARTSSGDEYRVTF